MSDPHHDPDLSEAIYWKTLCLSLPIESVETAFPSEDTCRSRFEKARWPTGATCPRCHSPQCIQLKARDLRQCLACRHQYSATTGTNLHRTRLGMLQWFIASEAVIIHKDLSWKRQDIPAMQLAEVIGSSYVTARRVREIILEDLSPRGAGLLKATICVRNITPPEGVPPDSLEHLSWLARQQP